MNIACDVCHWIALRFKINRDRHDAERLADTREAAQQHVKFHAAGLAKGEPTREVKEIANSNNGGK